MTVGPVGLDVRIKLGDSRSNRLEIFEPLTLWQTNERHGSTDLVVSNMANGVLPIRKLRHSTTNVLVIDNSAVE